MQTLAGINPAMVLQSYTMHITNPYTHRPCTLGPAHHQPPPASLYTPPCSHPAIQTLGGINPDVVLESYTMNITTLEGFDAFKATLEAPGSGGTASRVDLVLSCVDNYEARMTINQVGRGVSGRWGQGRVTWCEGLGGGYVLCGQV